MGFLDKVKNAFSMSEEEYFDDVDVEEEEAADYSAYQKSASPRRQRHHEQNDSNVVDMSSSFSQRSAAPSSPAKAHVVFEKIDSFEEVPQVADVLIDQRIVILNLETCSDDDSRRILDVLSGVNYANRGTIQRIAGRAYIITPNNVPLSGELLDEVATSAVQNRII